MTVVLYVQVPSVIVKVYVSDGKLLNENTTSVVVCAVEFNKESVNVYVNVPEGTLLFKTMLILPLLLLQLEFAVLIEETENEFGVAKTVEFKTLQRPASCTNTVKLPGFKFVNVYVCEKVTIV